MNRHQLPCLPRQSLPTHLHPPHFDPFPYPSPSHTQVFLHSITSRMEEMQLRRQDLTWWMNRHQLPPGLQRRVLRQEQQNFTATRGIDEEGLIRSMPKSLRRDIKRHLCLDLVKQVPLFQVVDSAALDAVCERLKPLILIHGTEPASYRPLPSSSPFLFHSLCSLPHPFHSQSPPFPLSILPPPSYLPRPPFPPPPLPPQLVSHPGWKLLWGRAALVGLGPLPKHQPASLRYCLALPTPLPILPPLTPQLVSHPGWQILRGRAALVVAGPLVSHPGWKLLWGRAALVAAGPLPGHQPDSKACPAIHLSHLPLELLPHPGWVFLWRGAALVGSRPLFHPDTHQLAAAAAVTPTSVCSPRLPSPIPCSSCLIRDGYFYGEELLSWGLGQSPDTNQLPSATATLTTVTAVEGFVLEAEDLLFVTTHFKVITGKVSQQAAKDLPSCLLAFLRISTGRASAFSDSAHSAVGALLLATLVSSGGASIIVYPPRLLLSIPPCPQFNWKSQRIQRWVHY
ncbi:unnamed protein product [Closterium sp. NIES-65]|nr:unnamed protein product [Closterium sp. NIES-65]